MKCRDNQIIDKQSLASAGRLNPPFFQQKTGTAAALGCERQRKISEPWQLFRVHTREALRRK